MSTAYSTQCLPSELECCYDPKSGKYFYIKSGHCPTTWEDPPRVRLQHQYCSPSSPSSIELTSTITSVPLQDMTNRTLERSSMIPVDEGLYKKLAGLFPSVQEDELRQLCKKNYNNELAIMGDLTARGYRAVYTPPTSTGRSAYAPVQGRYTSFNYSSQNSNAAFTTVSTTPLASTTINTAITSSSSPAAFTTNSSSANNVANCMPASPAPPTSNNRSNSPFTYYQTNSAQRTNYSPLAGKSRFVSHATNNPSPPPGAPQSAVGSPAPAGRSYYPGRFVQGVGFEAGSMGGSPRLTGRPFVPLQGRYSLSGMITEKNSTPKTHFVQPAPPREHHHVAQHVHPVVAHHAAAYPLPPASYPPPSSTPPPRSYSPMPSWYGEEDRLTTGSPQPSARFYNVVHDVFVKNKVTDRSASPPVSAPGRTYPLVYGSSPPYRGALERTATPQLYPYSSYGTGSSFYATASRLYNQSPKLPPSHGDHYGCGGALPAHSASQPYPHYQVPPRSQPGPPQPPAAVTHQQIAPPATAYVHPAYRNYSPVPSADGFPLRASPGSHSPKLKLRYLRRIYPGVDETFLLDVLSNADNNVQTAMEELKTMGYNKVDTPPVRPASAAHQPPSTSSASRVDTSRPKSTPDKDRPVAPPRRLTEADKQKTRARMLEKVKGVPAAILTIALESVHFDEDKAMILLNNMKAADERNVGSEARTAENETDGSHKDGFLANNEAALQNKLSSLPKPPAVPVRRSQKEPKDIIMCSKSTWTQEDHQFKSRYRTEAKGPNPGYRKGPNRELNSKEYGILKGANPENFKGHNPNLLLISQDVQDEPKFQELSITSSKKENLAKGHKEELHKGPQPALIQGSTYKFP